MGAGVSLSAADERRLQHQLDGLERRLVHHPEPTAVLVLTGHGRQRRVEAGKTEKKKKLTSLAKMQHHLEVRPSTQNRKKRRRTGK
jgi:hypothetical protein